MFLDKFLRLDNILNVSNFIVQVLIHLGIFNLIDHLISHILNILHYHVKVLFIIVLKKIIIREPVQQLLGVCRFWALKSRLLFHILVTSIFLLKVIQYVV